MNTNEINYTVTGNSARARVNRYHGCDASLEHHKGAKNSDIATLKWNERRNILEDEQNQGDFKSRFAVGFEVEKNRFHRGSVVEYPLFAGFERDSSCGYEAVTHILPLLPRGKWRNKVFNMMHEARTIIEDEFSPSNRKCGGHITVSVDGMDGYELMDAMRKNCGILLALFRHRLGNGYCNKNITMRHEQNSRRRVKMMGGRHHKYTVAKPMRHALEFRLPSRFQSVKQMMRRYEMMYVIVDHSINSPRGSHKSLLNKLKPILMSMYEQDETKVLEMMELAEAFRKTIVSNKINPQTQRWIDPTNTMAEFWDRDCVRQY